jgi:hypothetical protein
MCGLDRKRFMYIKNRKINFPPFSNLTPNTHGEFGPSPLLLAEWRLWLLQFVTPLQREKHSLLKCSNKWRCHWLPCNTVVLFYNFSPTSSSFKLIRLCYKQTIVNKQWVTFSAFPILYTCQIHKLTAKKRGQWAAHHLWNVQFKNGVRNYTHHKNIS